MKSEKISYEEAGCFSSLFLDYINKAEKLQSFYKIFPEIENFEEVIKNRRFSDEQRIELTQVLVDEYGPLRTTDAVDFNIHSLQNPMTFTVTTGHQLNIFTGPLYFIYKIVSVINCCAQLKEKYPEYHFVPVYWMASEDHDLAEINHFNLFGKKLVWETDQTGPVGRMKPHSLIDVIHQIGDEDVSLFEKAYLDYGTLADSVRHYVNKLFGDYGLVVVDGDNPTLKSAFAPVIKDELLTSTSNKIVEETSQKLRDLGYSDQAFSRHINLFYMEAEERKRIIRNGDQYQINGTESLFSEEEMLELVEQSPESFSPNVILRPLYQEIVLPNLAYIGGPAEVSYWLQLKGVFDYFDVDFPVLMPRNFALVINKGIQKKIDKVKLKALDLFKDKHKLKEKYLQQASESGYDLSKEKAAIAVVFEEIKTKATQIDGSLAGFVGAESAGTFKALDNIAKRMKKAEEQNNGIAMNQIDTIKDKLFPNGSLQERHDNFLSFYLNDPAFISKLLKNMDPFEFSFQLLKEK